MAEQQTEVGHAYYDGWQKQIADLRAELRQLAMVRDDLRWEVHALTTRLEQIKKICGS